MASSSLVRIAVVGDIHDDCDLEEDDTKALHFLKVIWMCWFLYIFSWLGRRSSSASARKFLPWLIRNLTRECSYYTYNQSIFYFVSSGFFVAKMIRCLLLISLLMQASSAQNHDHSGDGGVGDGPDPGHGGDVGGGPDPGSGGGGGGGDGQHPEHDVPTRKWPTLSGSPPLIIARGGLSGLFPESSYTAVNTILGFSDLALMCNLQLTKDSVGICLSEIMLDKTTNIRDIFPNNSKSYEINGKEVSGWFAKDYTSEMLVNQVQLIQNIHSRPVHFDNQFPVPTVDDIRSLEPPLFWLNVQYDVFYTKSKLSISDYIEKDMGLTGVHYISSPEIGFLKNMMQKVTQETKLVFAFLDLDAIEPTSKKKYSDILKNLNSIKDFASGILVPKSYIWPVDKKHYLGKKTTLVSDARGIGLEVYVDGFANDNPGSHNYSYDPTAEYLQFINDDADVTIDGMVTDFAFTAINAISCFATDETKKEKKRKSLVITHNGASGSYAGSTDLAYEKAVAVGADVIDCMVQMSKDRVAFCLGSPDLTADTTAMPTFVSKSCSVPEVQRNKGIFSFDLKWTEIQSLKPQIGSPYPDKNDLKRNPEAKNKGKFMTLDDFLRFAKKNKVQGVLIGIENAAYLASKKGLDIVDAVKKALKKASLKEVQVMIQSDDSSVLTKFQGNPNYKKLLKFKDYVGGVTKKVAEETKKYADGVVVQRRSLISIDGDFTKGITNIVEEMHAANLSVYVYVMRNEFVAIPYDFYGDPIVELDTYIGGLKVDGVITEFPATASRYLRSPCMDPKSSFTILIVQIGLLIQSIPPNALPQVDPPYPQIELKDLADPPLPSVLAAALAGAKSPPKPGPSPSKGGISVVADLGTVCVTTFMTIVLLLSTTGH